jgi:FlgD Ig-like domain
MVLVKNHSSLLSAVIILIVFAVTPALFPALADEPMLGIRLVDGDDAIYAVSDIDQLGFNGDETFVVVTAGGTDVYSTATITKIDFLWNFSSADDPRDAAALVKAIHLFQNQPNPFSPETLIKYELPQTGKVELGIYSVDGRLIRALVKQECVAGCHSVKWDGHDNAGQQVAGGVYFYSLRAPGIAESRRMILLP